MAGRPDGLPGTGVFSLALPSALRFSGAEAGVFLENILSFFAGAAVAGVLRAGSA